MKWSAIFLLSIFYFDASIAQQAGAGVQDGINRVNNDLLSSWMNDIRPRGKDLSDVEGSPYFIDNWVYGKIVSIKGERYADLNLKLNLYEKELMVQPLSSQDSFLLDDSKLLEFKFITHDSTYSFIRIQKLNGEKPEPYLDFYQLLVSGKANLLFQPIVELREPPKTTMATSGGRGNGYFSLEENYYLYNGTILEKLKKSKKSLLRAFQNHQREIDDFISENKLKLDNPASLIQIVNYYNQLN